MIWIVLMQQLYGIFTFFSLILLHFVGGGEEKYSSNSVMLTFDLSPTHVVPSLSVL